MSFRTPRFPRETTYFTGVELNDKGKTIARIACKGTLAGVLSLETNSVFVKSTMQNANKPVRVPVLVSPPVGVDSIKITKSKSLEGVKISIEEYNANTLLLDLALAPAGEIKPLTGTVLLSHASVQVPRALSVIVAKEKPVSISPALLRFEKVDDDDIARATAMIRLAKGVELNDSGPVAVSVGDRKLKVKLRRLTKRVSRVIVYGLPEDLFSTDSEQERNLNWTLLTNSGKIELTSVWEFRSR